MQIMSDDGQQASARAVRVVRNIFTDDSRTGRFNILLTASNSHPVLLLHTLSSDC